MKLLAMFMLAACLQASATGFAQKVTLRENNISLEKVFENIRKQTGFQFFYADDALKVAKVVSLSVKKEPLKNVLDLVFKDQPLTYTITTDNTIVIRRKEATQQITDNAPVLAPAPDPVIRGKVTDEHDQPMVGVSVRIKGQATGTATDKEGNFAIKAPMNSILVFSFVGYGEVERTVTGDATIAVSMKSMETPLDAVVVVGYGTQRKRDVTGSISTVKGEDIARMPGTNPVSSLQGKVPGLTIVNSGRAGSSPTVIIRGVNSTNNTSPLYVVDGVFQTDISYLNPGDIESIEVLRDPSSIAIFGLQGGNGVIVVTTKRAAKGQTLVRFQSSVGIQTVNNKIGVTDAAGFRKLYSAQVANSLAAGIAAADIDYTNYTANTNWQNLILQNAAYTNNTLSVSTSGEKSTTLFSLGYNNQDGVMRYDNFQRYIGRVNQETRITKDIRIGGDVTAYYWTQNNPGGDLNNAIWALPIVPIKVDNNTYYSMPSVQRAQVSNPVARMEQNSHNAINRGFRAVGNVFAEVKFLQHFTFKSTFYADLGFNNSRSYTALPFRYVNLGEGLVPTDTIFNPTNQRTSVAQAQSESRRFQQDQLLTYSKTFGKHSLTAMAGFTTLYIANSSLSGSRTDTSLNIPNDPNLWYLNIAQNSPMFNSGGGSEEAYMSWLSRVNYAYDGKYLVNLTFRRDGSSKFSASANHSWGNFGSVGLGWVVSREKFFANVKDINFLKLRASWGTVGSALGLATNLFRPALNTANVGVFGDNVYGSVTPAYVPDPNLHWEVVRGLDLGLEARALRDRLNIDFTYYNRTTHDILSTITLPGPAGNYSYLTNLGDISNKGIEVALGWSDKIGKDFTYSVNANFSYNQNRVQSIGDNINFTIIGNGGINKTETGKSIGYFYGYKQTGIYQTVADLAKAPAFSNSLPGDISYADVNKDGLLTADDRTYLGTPFPPYNFGGSISLGYKNFDLLIEGQGVAGNKVYTQRRTLTFTTLNYESNRLNAWTAPGTTNVEPILDNNRSNNFLFSSYFLEPGDYFRLRTLQLGYTFSSQMLKHTPIKQLRLYVSGQNIATFTKVTGYTPEVSLGNPVASGADNGTYPVPSIYSFGLNVTF